MKDSSYLKVVAHEWQLFRDGGSLGENPTVRKDILESWRRSRDALGFKEPQPFPTRLNSGELNRKLDESRELIASASPIMEQYGAMLQSSHSVIMLADPGGVILHRCGAAEIIQRMPHLDIGVIATETMEGTNGIGLCIALRRQVEIFGSEHYKLRDHGWCCVSAPLRDGMRRFIGVLTVVLPLKEFHSHTTGMLTAAARNINDQYHLRDLLSDRSVVFELFPDGVLILDRYGGIKAINSQGRNLLKLSSSLAPPANIADVVLSGEPFSSLLTSKKRVADREVFLQLKDERVPCVLSATPIPPDKGYVVTLTHAGRMQRHGVPTAGLKAIYTFDDIVGTSPALRHAVGLAEAAAQSGITTLIQGESGTGKELFAHAIHNAGPRRAKPFVIVNCGALPRELVQSELFGYEAGAFTGADKRGKAGKFELADGGTIFLDEIGEMPLEAQVSLLRLLQNGEISRIGGKGAKHVDVRTIAATNRDLSRAIREGAFREDLYYRLNVMCVPVPPLRRRPEDVMLLAGHFLRKNARSLNKAVSGFSPEAVEALQRYAWPGNVRELENAVERTLSLAAGPLVQVFDLPPHLREPYPPDPVPSDVFAPPSEPVERACPEVPAPPAPVLDNATLQSHESEFLAATLARHRGNIRAAARTLNISRSALYAKLARFAIRYQDFRP